MTRKQINQRIGGATALVTIAMNTAIKWPKVTRAWFLKTTLDDVIAIRASGGIVRVDTEGA
jgi:hypothetical protein